MSHYIKEQWQLAAQSVRHSSPDKVMEAYYGCMDQICQYSEKQLNSIHISAAVYGTAKVWVAAQISHRGWYARQSFHPRSKDILLRPHVFPLFACAAQRNDKQSRADADTAADTLPYY